MADASLDDFFAKKDKNKRRPKSKPEVPVNVDDSRAKPAKKDKKKRDKDKVNASGGHINVQSNTQEDEEWKDFEEAKAIDYSGLRIQTLQISKDDQDRDGGDGDDSGDDEDENKDRRDGASGPWNKSGVSGPSAPVPTQGSHSEVPSEEPAPKALGKYVPPAQRQGGASSTSSGKAPTMKKRGAPNVNSEEDFPTLGGGGPGTRKGSSQRYSSTVSSDLIDNPNQRRGAGLALENKFSALQD